MDPCKDVGERRCTRASTRRVLDMVAHDKGACAKGATERDTILSTCNKDPITMGAVGKGPVVDSSIGDKACTKTENGTTEAEKAHSQESGGRYGYDADRDCYTLEPVGSEERHLYVLDGTLFRELFQHQVEGVEWLWGIHCQYSGAIVADDMGLGKTFQAAVFLSGLMHSRLVKRAILIIPVSVLHQWIAELRKAHLQDFVQVYHECDDTGLKSILKNGGILLTTYETYASKHKKLMGSSKASWDYAILDEAHRIKNLNSQITALVNKIHSKKKILMTGTPIQKDLMDLYSLLNFISPGLLGDKETFRKKYLRPVNIGKYANATETEKEDYIKAVEGVRNVISTYVLRREKQVLIESGKLISKKHDMVVWLRLSNLQMELYRKFDEICQGIGNDHKQELTMIKLVVCQGICNSPALLLKNLGDKEEKTLLKSIKNELIDSLDAETLRDTSNSCKTTFVLDLVKEIFEEEKKEKDEKEKRKKRKDKEEERKVCKILIFSRSVKMLDLLQESLSEIVEGDDITRIDGSVNKDGRKKLIKKFGSDDGPRIFLLSARVGGEGLNLTAATRLIIVDPSWNSSDDKQISDRVYRIGQNEDCYIYRLVTCRTVEEHAYKTQLLKGALGRGITEGMVCASSVHKKDGKVLCLPDSKVGFDSSETHHLLESTKANKLDFAGRHLKFLTRHQLVSGLTNQNFVLSIEQTSLSDLSQDLRVETLEEAFQKNSQMSSTNSDPNKREDAALKKQVLATKKISRRMEIPEKKVGLLIGRDGQTIRNIRLLNSADIYLENARVETRSSQRSVQIVGTIKEVEKAQKMIAAAISEADKEEEYLHVPLNMVPTVIGCHGKTVIDIREKSGAHVQFIEHKKGFRLAGTKQQIDCAKELIHNIIDKTKDKYPESQEKYLAVPETKVGLVIGKEGWKIKEIRQKSGAYVQYIDQKNGFLLRGGNYQIDIAESLILEIINTSGIRGSGHPQHGGRMPTSGVAIGGLDGSQRIEMPSQPVSQQDNRSQYYGERGQPRTPRPRRNC